MMECRASEGSTVSSVAVLTRHKLLVDILFSFLSMKYTLKYVMQLSEGFWDKTLHSKSRTQVVFFKVDFFF